MKVLQLGIALLLCLFLFNCSKDENPTPETDAQETENPKPDETQEPDPDETQEPEMEVYFEAVISDFYPTDNAGNWLLTHDKEGKILDYISFEKNDTIRFEIPRTSDLDEFTVTDIRFSTLTSSSPYFINSHTEVVKGSSWIFAPPYSPNQGGPRPESTGNFRISVSGIPQALSMFYVSNESANGNGNGAYSVSITPGEGWRYEKRAELFEDNDYYITLVNGLGDTRYYYLEGAQQSQEYDLGYDEFSEFGSHINMELLGSSEISVVLIGYSTTPAIPGPGYELYILYGDVGEDISRSFELGHPGNELEAYRLLFSNRQQDFGYTFNYFGTELPDNLIVPQRPLFNVDNPEIKGFEISTNLDYKRKEISWSNLEPRSFGNNRRIEWKVFSSFTSSSVIGDIPEEILNRYPDMDVSGLTYEYSHLHVGPYSQNEFLEAKFRGEDYEILFSNLEFFYFYQE